MKGRTKKIILSAISIVLVLAITAGGLALSWSAFWTPEKKDVPLFPYARTELLKTFDPMELGEKATPKRKIDNENPLNLVNFYMDEDLSLFWNSIPESQRKLSILLIIPSHVFLPTTQQALEKMEQTADECERLGIPYVIQNTMGEAFMEELMPIQYLEERFAKQHKYFYGLSCAELYNGVLWRGETDSDLTLYVSQVIKMCAKYGAFFIWTDTNLRYGKGMLIEWLERSETLYDTFKEYSTYIYMLCKDTSMRIKYPLPMPTSYSIMEGLWLSGLIGGWGVACDWWSFSINHEEGKASLFHENDNLIDHYSENGFSYPENLFTMAFAYVVSKGAVCFKAEAPNMSMTVGGKPVAGFEYSMMPFLDSLINGRLTIPSKEEVLNDTKAAVVGILNYPYFNYNTKESYRFANSGDLGIIPLLPKNVRLEERAVFENQGIELIQSIKSKRYYNSLFGTVEANTYATRTANQWYYVNVVENERAKRQAKLYPVISSSEFFTIDASEHTYAIVKETQNSLQFNINNYRTDKTALLKGVTSESSKDWVDISTEYMTLKEDGNPILDDSVKRNTTITVKGTLNGGEPSVEFLNNSDGSGKYNRPYTIDKSWDSANSILTISISHNGPVTFDVILDSSDKKLDSPSNKKIEPTKKTNNNSVERLEKLLSECPKIDAIEAAKYSTYSYLQYDRAVSKAKTIIAERTYSKGEISTAIRELKIACGKLVYIGDSVKLLNDTISADYTGYSKEQYDNIMNAYDRLLRELLSPKYYVDGKNDREILGLSKSYKKLGFTKIQVIRKEKAIETYTDNLKKVIEENKL